MIRHCIDHYPRLPLALIKHGLKVQFGFLYGLGSFLGSVNLSNILTCLLSFFLSALFFYSFTVGLNVQWFIYYLHHNSSFSLFLALTTRSKLPCPSCYSKSVYDPDSFILLVILSLEYTFREENDLYLLASSYLRCCCSCVVFLRSDYSLPSLNSFS